MEHATTRVIVDGHSKSFAQLIELVFIETVSTGAICGLEDNVFHSEKITFEERYHLVENMALFFLRSRLLHPKIVYYVKPLFLSITVAVVLLLVEARLLRVHFRADSIEKKTGRLFERLGTGLLKNNLLEQFCADSAAGHSRLKGRAVYGLRIHFQHSRLNSDIRCVAPHVGFFAEETRAFFSVEYIEHKEMFLNQRQDRARKTSGAAERAFLCNAPVPSRNRRKF